MILFQEQIYLCHGLLVASWLHRPNVGVRQGIKRGSNINAAVKKRGGGGTPPHMNSDETLVQGGGKDEKKE